MAGEPVVDPALRMAILSCIEEDGGPIFGHYKTNSLDRRLLTRLETLGCRNTEEYLARLRTEEAERRALVESLMVGVTSFFRDPAVYDAIRRQVAEPLLCAGEEAQIRVWSAACSTGQEPYSLAMLFAEAAEDLGKPLRLHIFATDISGQALRTASVGIYNEEGLEGLSDGRRERWLAPAGLGHWKVRDELRQMITFAPHDITRDPAFPRMDLVCARNLLIYLNQEGQERALQLFHFALLPGGVLAVGESELTAGHRDIFRPLPTAPGLLRKLPLAKAAQADLAARNRGGRLPAEWEPPLGSGRTGSGRTQTEPAEMVEAWFQQRGGAGFFLDDRERVVFAFGDIWQHVPPPRGRLADFSLRDLPDETLRICLRDAVRRAGEQREACGFVIPAGAVAVPLAGQVEPFLLPSGEPGYLLLLDPGAPVPPVVAGSLDLEETTRAYLGHLELRCTHLETELQEQLALRNDGEERLRATNEELRAANEEQLSINEELRATTEELREKVNELTAAKQEIERSHEIQAVAAAEKTAILDHLMEGVLYLTTDFRCQWANAAVAEIGGCRVEDLRGRPCHEALFGLSHVCPGCPVLDVLQTGQSHERMASEMPNGRTMWLAASPVCDEHGKLVGVVEHYRDITDELQLKQELAEREQLFRGIYEASPLAIMVFNRSGCLEHANPSCLAMFGTEDNLPELQRLRLFEHWRLNGPQSERIRAGKTVRFQFDFAFHEARENGLYRTTRDDLARLDLTVSPLRSGTVSAGIVGYLVQIEEVTQQYQAERERERVAHQYREVFENANTILVRTGPTLLIEELNREAEETLGLPRASALGRNFAELLLPDASARTGLIATVGQVLGGDPVQGYLLTVASQDGQPRTCLWNLVRATDAQERPVGLILSGTDVTERHVAEERRREQNERLLEAEHTARVGHWQWREGSGHAVFSAGARRVFGLEGGEGPVNDESFWGMVHPEDRALLEDANRATISTRESREVSYRIQTPGGDLRHIRETQHLLLDGSGQTIGLRGAILDITQLKEAEEYWRLALDSVGDGVWTRNPQTGEARWSDNWYRMLGMEPGEIPSNYGNLCRLMHPDDMPAAQAAIQACMECHADTYTAEFRLRHKAGHWVWILSRGRVMERDERGLPSRFAGTQMDISARKAIEERLARREHDLQEIFEGTSPVTGEQLLERLTLHLDRVLGLDYSFVSEVLPEDDPGFARMLVFRGPDGVLEPCRYSLAGSPSARALLGEIVFCQDDAAEQFPKDEELTLLGIRGYIAVPLQTTGGHILGVMGAMSGGPIEDSEFVLRIFRIFAARAAAELEQRRAVDSLRRTEQRLRQVVQNMPVLVIAHDQDGRVLFWNAECERVSGYSAADVVGKPECPVQLQTSPDGEADAADASYRGAEGTLTTQAGATRTILWSDISARCPIPGWARWAVGIDITEQRKYEDSFRRAQKMSAVGELAAGVAHDFNNLLHVVLGSNELLLQGRENDPDVSQACRGIKQAAERGAELVRQLMYFSRRETFHPEPCNLNELVNQSLVVLRRGTGADVVIEFFPDLRAHAAKADAGQVGQVLLNLCLNARDAMRGRNGRIDIRTRNQVLSEAEAKLHGMKPGPYVVIEVADTGEGIPLHIQEQIFEPFFTTKGKANGSGLGLASAYAIMERHGGGITFDTMVGKGTTFHLFFPEVKALPASPQQTPPAPVASPSAALAHRTILVAEDEAMVLQLAVRTLRRAGANVLPARDGREAVELFRENADQIDAVLMDAIMPRMNGRDAYLAMLEIRPRIPALFASGYSADILMESTLEGLNVEAVQKPIPPALLVQKLAALIQG